MPESDAICLLLKLARKFGHGNLIAHLKTDWINIVRKEFPDTSDLVCRLMTDIRPYNEFIHDSIVDIPITIEVENNKFTL